jgi:YHS domain-containing protein
MKQIVTLAILLIFATAPAQRMRGADESQRKDMTTIHSLMAVNKSVKRTVTKLPNGVKTLTESDDPKVAALIQEHVAAMQKRMKDGAPIRLWDPLFAELFSNHQWVKFAVTKTAKGMAVTETSEDAYVIKLIHEHAKAVDGFIAEGMAGMHKEHPAPGKPENKAEFLGKGDGVTTCPVTGEPVDKNVKAEINGRTVYFCCPACMEKVKKDPKRYLKGE